MFQLSKLFSQLTDTCRLAFPVQFGKIIKILKEMVDTVTFDITVDKFSAITLDGMPEPTGLI